MSDPERARSGDWVEVERTILDPSQRSKNLPPETAEKPLLMWVKGFALADGALGDEMTVETMTGRRVSGRLSAINPGYFHTFGRPIPELVHVGKDLRERLATYRGEHVQGPRETEKGGA
jgi:hypothetical protein